MLYGYRNIIIIIYSEIELFLYINNYYLFRYRIIIQLATNITDKYININTKNKIIICAHKMQDYLTSHSASDVIKINQLFNRVKVGQWINNCVIQCGCFHIQNSPQNVCLCQPHQVKVVNQTQFHAGRQPFSAFPKLLSNSLVDHRSLR